ncbi:alanyl-tRNA editing protein [Acetonema longum]|uniref:Threonyl/alanyl tRNA synthetase SAD n=1 Tax=Acetonema longum DSM 6540 TaxID=1009370 RepID=F7NGJ0_9FIRM|nr:DHHA1 domain-containing protein [Acetonema longum]EGO64794.1 threonyl/alanyl tRNA synthetase SAD [Acetonema longum DSM 6540]
MSTLKIYHQNAYCREFTAEVLTTTLRSDSGYDIELDRTVFYPESGGQPYDTGSLNGIPVIAMRQEGDKIIHTTPMPLAAGPVTGVIDWGRRYDHMQQHSGEHVLCGAAFNLYGANNVGFSLGPAVSHIDLDLETLSEDQVKALEQAANQAICDCRPVKAQMVTGDELSRFPLRKGLSKSFSHIRLIEVQDFDCCPCGGTHVANTGEIGLIKILTWEKKKKAVRVHFVCGKRALDDYAVKHAILQQLAVSLSVTPYEVGKAYLLRQDKQEHLQRELTTAKKTIARYLARELHQAAEMIHQVKIVTFIQPVQEAGEIADLTNCLMEYPDTIALVAGIQAETNRAFLQFAAASGITVNMTQELRKILPQIGGKGGGTASAAQGGCPADQAIGEAIAQARASISASLPLS